MLNRPGFALLICLTLPAGASAATLPSRQPGLWQNTTVISGVTVNGKPYKTASRPVVTVMCDPGGAISLAPPRDAQEHCPPPVVTEDSAAKSFTISETCKLPDGVTTTADGTLTVSGDKATHLLMRSTSPTMSSTMLVDSLWLGACPAGVAPGAFGRMVNGKFVAITAAAPGPHP